MGGVFASGPCHSRGHGPRSFLRFSSHGLWLRQVDSSRQQQWDRLFEACKLARPPHIHHRQGGRVLPIRYGLFQAHSKPTPGSPGIGPINAPSMIKGDQADFQRTATAFAPVANIYAPYYRQVDAMVQKSMTPANQIKAVAGIPTTDAIAAFEYYLQHYNDGRAFILAGHSQGSSVLSHLL